VRRAQYGDPVLALDRTGRGKTMLDQVISDEGQIRVEVE
jgi:hypothetical protein